MTGEPWRATQDGVVVACRLTPKGGRDAIDGVARLSDGTAVLLARVRTAAEDGRAKGAADRWIEEPAEAGHGDRRPHGADRKAASVVTARPEAAPVVRNAISALFCHGELQLRRPWRRVTVNTSALPK